MYGQEVNPMAQMTDYEHDMREPERAIEMMISSGMLPEWLPEVQNSSHQLPVANRLYHNHSDWNANDSRNSELTEYGPQCMYYIESGLQPMYEHPLGQCARFEMTSEGKRRRRRVITLEQRKAANVRERRRMFHVNDAFDKLSKKVPTFAYEKKLSRIDTLKLAAMYIRFMMDLLKEKDNQIADDGADSEKENNSDIHLRPQMTLNRDRAIIKENSK